ncbi:hypothetical protein A3860_33450 [Niastella vici]|uniref:Uncharacterized protein n=1 Tax=Niastella vici TaxID=1703345 RepID=A0A1V9FQ11_9BACT|nr:choice-of-anchor Q domain-containing protein [Niastella vici]OQP60432.1 hypothetical protein A3860_33450 [Niastella vici]
MDGLRDNNISNVQPQQDAHSFFQDPLFTSLTTPDLHLKTGSPAVGKGNPAWITDATEKDYDGKPRVVNGLIDMGAYEQQ